MKKAILLTLLILFSLSLSGKAYAQIGIGEEDIVVTMSSENPRANQDILVTLNSFVTNINTANITWRVNGTTELQGIGEKSFSFNTGNSYSTTLGIIVRTSEGQTINKTITIRPSDVDLVWESDGFTPPFYKGKTLFSHQNKITLTAIPHIRTSSGSEFSPNNLLYTWKKDGSVIESVSGYGKKSMTLTGSLISRPMVIEVEVMSPTTNTKGLGRVSINPTDPMIIIYRRDPLYGIEFQKALSGVVSLENSRELSVVGIPMFYGVGTPNNQNLRYKWLINGIPINQNSYSQVFRQVEGTSGTSRISLSIEHLSKILQYDSLSFDIFFRDNQVTNNLFE